MGLPDYGSAEEVVGKYLEASLEDDQPSVASNAVFFTKWCPKPELSTEQDVKVRQNDIGAAMRVRPPVLS